MGKGALFELTRGQNRARAVPTRRQGADDFAHPTGISFLSPRECRQRAQDRPADGEDLIAAPERQRERRLHLGIAGDAAQRQRHDGRIAAGPYHHRSLGAQIAEIDPGRTAGIAVDQHPRLLARVMADVAAGPHIRDHVDERPAGGSAKAPRELIREPIAGIEHRAVALIERRQHRIIGGEDERKQHEYYGP